MQYSLDGMALEKKLWNEYPNNRWVGLNYSNSLYNLSVDYLKRDEIDKALELRNQCHTIRRRLYEDAKAGIPDESGLGFFNFQDKYGKICFLLAQLLITKDIQTERIPDLLATAIEVLGDMHEQNQANDEYRTLLAGAYETKAKFEMQQKRYQEAVRSAQQSFDVAVGKTESEMRLLSEPQYQQLRIQQIDTAGLLASALFRSGDVTKAQEQLKVARSMAEQRGYGPDELGYPESVLDAARIMGELDNLAVETKANKSSENGGTDN
jgi:tetratricopeptide (TPR) repeat protein